MSEVNARKTTKLTVISDARSEPREEPRVKGNGSTGPVTAEGKLIASSNSIQHGCTASFRLVKGRLTPESEARLVMPDEELADWEELRLNWESEYQPVSELHLTLVTQACIADWILRRTIRRYTEAEHHLYKEKSKPTEWSAEQHALLERFLRYQTKAERAFYRARMALEQLRREKKRDHEKAQAAEARPASRPAKTAGGHSGPDAAAASQPVPVKRESALIQCITVQVIDGKTITIFQPLNENFSNIILNAAEPKPVVKRALYFLHGIPEEYSWVTEYEKQQGRPHIVIVQTAAEALADLANEREQGAKHLLKSELI